ncbi:MAG: hypothetical protein IRY90_14190, partial [Actinomadura rubrobrunea]|nr:hypothetical protein [Actinomadura rubrobrunea]
MPLVRGRVRARTVALGVLPAIVGLVLLALLAPPCAAAAPPPPDRDGADWGDAYPRDADLGPEE